MTADNSPRIAAGERLSLSGRSGSGKTYLARWFMARSALKWVVLDTKHDPSFDRPYLREGLLPYKDIVKVWADNPVCIVRPSPTENRPKNMDAYLGGLHDAFENFGILIDECYQVSFGPHPGEGMTAVLTRGRVRRQACIMGAQRPAFIPKFIFSEANYFAVMSLNMIEDRERVEDYIGNEAVLEKLPPRKWFWYDVADDQLKRFGPVTINQVVVKA
jgi:hypothetical protein